MWSSDKFVEFELVEVKVPISFFGTVGFSLRREGRYIEESLCLSIDKDDEEQPEQSAYS